LFFIFLEIITLYGQYQNCDQLSQISSSSLFVGAERFTNVSTLKPSFILILPQSFKVPTKPTENEELSNERNKLKQYVAIINNAQNDQEDQVFGQQYKRLSLQVRDAAQPLTGQLFDEQIFDYFPRNQQLLIPIKLDQISPIHERSAGAQLMRARQDQSDRINFRSANLYRNADTIAGASLADAADWRPRFPSIVRTKPQQIIVSIRPHQFESGFSSDVVELVSSAPIVVEPVSSNDGRRSFSIVQTDKPIYKPDERVKIRILLINENLRPIVNDEFKIQIKNPHNLVVEEVRYPRPPDSESQPSSSPQQGSMKEKAMFVDHLFDFPPEPMLGTWSVHLLHDDPVANDTTSFEVREYVLPPFEISFELPRYVLPHTNLIAGTISAKYHYGEPVQGKVLIKFGFKESPMSRPRYIARSGIKTIDPKTGQVDFKIKAEKFRDIEWFPTIAGSRLVIEATVTEISTGHRETAQDTSCTFITNPYRFSFEDSITDFKPGLVQQLSVQLVDSLTHLPGPAGERIVAFYYDRNGTLLSESGLQDGPKQLARLERYETEAVTDSMGKAVFNIGPIEQELSQIHVMMRVYNESSGKSVEQFYREIAEQIGRKRLNQAHKLWPELAIGQHTLNRYESQNGWITLMNKTITHLKVGEEFISDVLIRDNILISQRIFYIITSRGHIVTLDRLNSDGLIKFRISEEMIPAIRIVLFALTQDSVGLMSDSMRVNVGEDLGCDLSVEYVSNERRLEENSPRRPRPNEKGRLRINARSGDVVSIISTDKAVYTLNNRTRLDSLRIIERIKRLDSGCGFGGGVNNLDVFHNAGLMFSKGGQKDAYDDPMTAYIGSSCLTLQNHLKYLDDAQMGYTKPIFAQLDRLASVSPLHKVHSRAKREADISSLLLRYKDPVHRACCRLATLEDLPHKRNCSIRAKIVQKYMQNSDHPTCAHIYQTCCQTVFGEEVRYSSMSPVNELIEARNLPHQHATRSEIAMPNVGQLDQLELNTLVRKDFRETWLFELIPVNERNGVGSIDVQLPHSITTWTVSAMALNEHKAMCLMGRPYSLNVFQEIFVDISMPYKVVRGEQIDLVAKIFNHSPKDEDVLVYMHGIEHVCSEAEPGERSGRKRVRVDRHSSQSVLFPMIPLRTGKFPVKIVAIALVSNSSDIVERQLNVVPRGRTVTDETTFSLDPLNQQRRSKRNIQTGNLVDEIDSSRGLQRSRVRLAPSRDSEYIVPQTQECIVSAIGDRLGQTVQTTILDVENLIRLPHGCGEQVMIYMGPTLYTARYLSAINKLIGDIRWRAIRYIQIGYKSILNFRKQDGSFSAFSHRDPSIWLTAFVAKLLCQTENTPFIASEVHVDKTVINMALKWLIEVQNKDTGEWTEWNPVYHREMLGGTLRENVLTAFVSVALNECSHHGQDIIEDPAHTGEKEPQDSGASSEASSQTSVLDKMKLSMQSAQKALVVKRLEAVKNRNPYALALVAYALSLQNAPEATLVLSDLLALAERSHSRNQMFWRGEHQIETAAYALQALIEIAPYAMLRDKDATPWLKTNWNPGQDALSVANWLSSRRSYTGAFESTQDTIVALEALSKFAQMQSNPKSSVLLSQTTLSGPPKLVCNVTVNNRTERSIEFGEDNAQVLQTFRIDTFDFDANNGDTLDITTSGSGLGTMSVKLKYNVFQEEDELCRFNIDSTIEEWQPQIVSQPEKDDAHNLTPDLDHQNSGADSQRYSSPGEEKSNDTIDDTYFKTFDKTMLRELNLIDHSHAEQGAPLTGKRHPSSRQPDAPLILRVRRTPLDSRQSDSGGESWASKVVSTIRSRLPSWILPKSTNQSKLNSTSSTSPVRRDHIETQGNPIWQSTNVTRRSSTSRRSARGGVPSIGQATGMADSVHVNDLSRDIEISAQNKSVDLGADSTKLNGNQLSSIEPSNRLVLLLRICVHHMGRRDSEMAVIEIGILSGFKPNEADLKEIINDSGTPAMKFELSPDRSVVIIYMQHIPNSGPYCLQFRLIRDALVYNLQSGYIRVYEYYSPRHSCSNFYTPSRVSDLIKAKCDSSGQVCECASKSLCPATNKLITLSEIHQVNITSARNQLIDLVCSSRYDLVSLIRLKNVKQLDLAKQFKLFVKVKSDLKGNLTKIIDAQRQQRSHLINSVRKPAHNMALDSISPDSSVLPVDESGTDESSIDQLTLTIDSTCVHNDPFLLHLAHPNQWRQGGELMILFAKSEKLERKLFKTTMRPGAVGANRGPPIGGPRPKANTWSGKEEENNTGSPETVSAEKGLIFRDAQQQQYSLHLALDRDSIIHDLTYQAKTGPREAVNNLVLWLELRSRRSRWTCP